MTKPADKWTQKARDLDGVGCGCRDDEEAANCDFFKCEEACRRPREAIARALEATDKAATERAAQKADKWNEISDQQIRLMAGEMTAQEIRTAKAVAAGIAAAIRKGTE